MKAATTSMISSIGSFLPGNLEGVVAAGHDVNRRALQPTEQGGDLVGGAERIARALHEQHSLPDPRQVFVAALLRFARCNG